MPQALTGSRSSIPKLTRVNADDSRALIYRNLGNGRRLPLLLATTVSLVSGTSQQTVVASDIAFHGFNICEAKVEITPIVSGTGSTEFPDSNILGNVYIVKNATDNQLILKSTVEMIPDVTCNFDVYIYFGTSTDFNSTDSNQIWK
jgi:hypothetical protein